jgi:hypothetical protein
MADQDFGTKVAVDAGSKVKEAITSMLAGKDGAGLGVRTIANVAATIVAIMGMIVMAAFSAVFRIATVIGTIFLEGFEAGRLANQDTMNAMAAALLSDLLGIEVDGSDIPKGGSAGQQIQRAEAIGGKFIDLIEGALGGQPGDGGNAGAKAARAFSGFNISSAIGAGMIGVITEIESLGFLKEWGELGEGVIRTLGLSRLSRRALAPLVNALITSPYTRFMNEKYRPEHLTVPEVLRAMLSGRMDESTATGHLAALGYSDDYITELRIQGQPAFSPVEVDTLVRWGKIDRTEGLRMLRQQGWPDESADLKLTAIEAARADGQVAAYAEELFQMARDRFIDSATYTTLIDRLPISEDEKQRRADRLGIWLEAPHKRLSLSEILFLLEHLQLNDGDLHTWAINSGFSEDDAFTLETWASLKVLDFDKKQAAADARAKLAAAKQKCKDLGLKYPCTPP